MAQALPVNAQSFPELNILLFNVDGNNLGPGGAYRRRECMKHVLNTVLQERYTSLFVLAQDKINGPKHKLLLDKLGDGRRAGEEAGIYCKCSLHVTFLDQGDLTTVHGAMQLAPNEHFTIAKLQTCIVQYDINQRVLLCSWHGPHVAEALTHDGKKLCFQRLLQFVEKLRCTKNCDLVIIGGDFNLPVEMAKEALNSNATCNGYNCEVMYDYVPPEDRRDLALIDYLVVWPKGMFEALETCTVLREYERTADNLPFDHGIVFYKLGNRWADLAMRLRQITLDDFTADLDKEVGFPLADNDIMTRKVRQAKSRLMDAGAVYVFSSGVQGMEGQRAQSVLSLLPGNATFRVQLSLITKIDARTYTTEDAERALPDWNISGNTDPQVLSADVIPRVQVPPVPAMSVAYGLYRAD